MKSDSAGGSASPPPTDADTKIPHKVAGTLRVPLLVPCVKQRHTECACYFGLQGTVI
jgi:hypothetical protein